MLKLFTVPEIQKNKQAQITRDILRNQEVQKVTHETQYRLSKMEADFADSLAKMKERQASEEEKHSIRLSEMDKEVKELQNKKEQALIPIEIEKKKADTILEQVEKRLIHVQEKELENENLKEVLLKRLDDVLDREVAVFDEEERIKSLRESIKLEKEQTEKNTKNLSESILKFNIYVESEKNRLSEKEKVQFLESRTIEAGKGILAQKEKELQEWSVRLKDMENMFKREFEKIKNGKRKERPK